MTSLNGNNAAVVVFFFFLSLLSFFLFLALLRGRDDRVRSNTQWDTVLHAFQPSHLLLFVSLRLSTLFVSYFARA